MLQEISGDKLRVLRKRAKLTQSQASELAGVSEYAIFYLEKGQRKPQTRTLEKLLSLYAIRIQYWRNIDKVFEENTNGGNIPAQAAFRK